MFRGLWADFMWHSYRIIFKSLATDLPLRSPCISGAFPPFPSTTRLHPATGDDGRDSTPFPSRLSEFRDGGDVRWPSPELKWRHRLPNQTAVKAALQFGRGVSAICSISKMRAICWWIEDQMLAPPRKRAFRNWRFHSYDCCLSRIYSQVIHWNNINCNNLKHIVNKLK